jgi:hypothetical protein
MIDRYFFVRSRSTGYLYRRSRGVRRRRSIWAQAPLNFSLTARLRKAGKVVPPGPANPVQPVSLARFPDLRLRQRPFVEVVRRPFPEHHVVEEADYAYDPVARDVVNAT